MVSGSFLHMVIQGPKIFCVVALPFLDPQNPLHPARDGGKDDEKKTSVS